MAFIKTLFKDIKILFNNTTLDGYPSSDDSLIQNNDDKHRFLRLLELLEKFNPSIN